MDGPVRLLQLFLRLYLSDKARHIIFLCSQKFGNGGPLGSSAGFDGSR